MTDAREQPREPFAQTWTGIGLQLLIDAWLGVVAWALLTGRLVWRP